MILPAFPDITHLILGSIDGGHHYHWHHHHRHRCATIGPSDNYSAVRHLQKVAKVARSPREDKLFLRSGG